jgi:hypothetical protein
MGLISIRPPMESQHRLRGVSSHLNRSALIAGLCVSAALLGCDESGSTTATATREPSRHQSLPVVLASDAVGRITADCSAPSRAVFAFRADRLTPSESVTATVGGKRVHAEVDPGGRPVTIAVRMRNLGSGHGRFPLETPTVRWRVLQSHEPATTLARAALRVTSSDGRCVVTHAELHLQARSHGG